MLRNYSQLCKYIGGIMSGYASVTRPYLKKFMDMVSSNHSNKEVAWMINTLFDAVEYGSTHSEVQRWLKISDTTSFHRAFRPALNEAIELHDRNEREKGALRDEIKSLRDDLDKANALLKENQAVIREQRMIIEDQNLRSARQSEEIAALIGFVSSVKSPSSSRQRVYTKN